MGNEIGDFLVGKDKASAQSSVARKTTETSLRSLFDSGVIDTEQKFKDLLSAYLCGEISFGSDGLTSKEAAYVNKCDIDQLYDSFKSSNSDNKKTMYIVQLGDSPYKIAKTLLGRNASKQEIHKLAMQIIEKAKNSKLYKSYGLTHGDILYLDGDYSDAIQEIKNNNMYTELSESLDNEYKRGRRKRTADTQVQNVHVERDNSKIIHEEEERPVHEKSGSTQKGTQSIENHLNDNVTLKPTARVKEESKTETVTKHTMQIHVLEKQVKDGIFWGLDGNITVYPLNIQENPSVKYSAPKIDRVSEKDMRNEVMFQDTTPQESTYISNPDLEFLESQERSKKEFNKKLEKIQPLLNQAGIEKLQIKYNDMSVGSQKPKITYYYKNGKVVEEYYDNCVKHRDLISGDIIKPFKSEVIIDEAIPMQISLNLPSDLTSEAKSNAIAFAKTLEDNKSMLMKVLEENGYKIDNDLYDMLARLSLAMAENETQFGTNCRAGKARKEKYRAVEQSRDNDSSLRATWGREKLNEVIFFNNVLSIVGVTEEKKDSWSLGYTQIKYDDHIENCEQYKKILAQLGISDHDLFTPSGSAMATIALLAICNEDINNPKIRSAITAAESSIAQIDGVQLEEGKKWAKTGSTEPFVNRALSWEEALMYYWNKPGALIRGDIDPAASAYCKKTSNALKHYTVNEDEDIRHEIITKKKEVEKDKNTVRNLSEQPYGGSVRNCGALGSIEFTQNSQITKEQLDILKNNLSHLPPYIKGELMEVAAQGKIKFKFGLTANEVKSITKEDAKLIIRYSQYENKQKATSSFRRKYLTTKAATLSINNVKQKEVICLSATRPAPVKWKAGGMLNAGIKTSAGIIIYSKETKCFYKYNPSNKTKVLFDVNTLTPSEFYAAMQMSEAVTKNSGNNCLQYWRDVAIKSGIDAAMSPSQAEDVSRCGKYKIGLGRRRDNLVEYEYKTSDGEKYKKQNDRYYLQEGTAKASIKWFERHPEMFTEVKWVIDTSKTTPTKNDRVRQITIADLPNLPAGYIVVWIPGPGYENQPGHISVTGGNGLAYADEADNLGWSDMASGKGEHGTFKVYKLTDNWKVNAETGKLEFRS